MRDLVIESGLTQQAIADVFEVDRARITAMLKASDMKLSTALKWSKVLKVSVRTVAESMGMDVSGIPDDCIGGNEDK